MDVPHAPAPTSRLASLDAYRGFVMLLMMGEVLHFCRVAEALPQSGFWQALCHHQSHAAWTGCTLHDLIQPSFSFIVGVAVCFSVARRRERGGPTWRMTAHAPWRKVLWLAAVGLIGLAAGALLGWLGICPVVKRIWTPSWVLFSGGWCLLFLAGFYAVIDVRGWRRWAFPLVVIGMNSIAAYCMDWLFVRFIAAALPRHLGEGVFRLLGDPLQPLVHGAAVLLVLWLILFWMYRRKIYLRV